MTSPANPPRGAFIALAVTILFWAYSWVVMKEVLAYIGPFNFSALRYFLGALVLFAAMLAARQSLRPPPLRATILIGLFQTAAFQGFEQVALVNGGAGHVALLAYTMPFWAVLLAWVILHDRPTRAHWFGVAFAAAGLVFIIEPWHGLGNATSTLLAIVGGATWAAGTVLSKKLFRERSVSALSLTAWQMLIGGVALGVLALAVPQRPTVWNGALVAGLAYCVLFASSLAWWLWSIVLARLPTTLASVGSLGVPIVSVLLAWWILAERPSPSEWLGIALVLVGLCAVSGVRLRR